MFVVVFFDNNEIKLKIVKGKLDGLDLCLDDGWFVLVVLV